MKKSTHSIIRRIAFIGNYMPRKCGIATFTSDLLSAGDTGSQAVTIAKDLLHLADSLSRQSLHSLMRGEPAVA